MKIQKVTQQLSSPSNTPNRLVLRRTRKRFNPKIFIDRIIETTAIGSLLFTGFAGVGAFLLLGFGDCYEFSLLVATEKYLLGGNVGELFSFLGQCFDWSEFQYSPGQIFGR
jgi:hypothetical protein